MMGLTQKRREPTPNEVRQRIEKMPNEIYLQSQTWPLKIDGVKLRSLDQYLLLSASRISEAITTQRPCEREGTEKTKSVLNTGMELILRLDSYEGEEVAIWDLKTLKRKDHVIRSVALPLNPKYEPWTKQLVEDWGPNHDINPWNISRQHAWAANRLWFKGMYYNVKGGMGESWKGLGNHGLRHIRIKELIQTYGLSPLEIQRFVGWTAGSLKGLGVNPMMDTYFSLYWRDYFPKLLKEGVHY